MAKQTCLAAFCIVLMALCVVTIAVAGFQHKESVCQLTVDESEELCLHDGRICLASNRWADALVRQDAASQNPGAEVRLSYWRLNAPTIWSGRGSYLSRDPNDKELHLVLDSKKGEHTEWAFDFIKQEHSRRAGIGLREGFERSTFRLVVANGTFKGYYVGADAFGTELEQAKRREPAFRALKLVKDKRDAIKFDYIETKYWTTHKN